MASGSGEPILELLDATVVKGDTRALDGVTLTIRAGEHTAILGPNGAGKTTLINALTYHDRAQSRADGPPPVRVFGDAGWNVFELRPQLGVVSHDLQQQFVAGHSAGRIRGKDAVLSGFFATQGYLGYSTVTPEMRVRAAAALARADASELADKWIDEMSTGEARRVLIARALVNEPRALLLDEPSAGLDVAARHRLLTTIRHLARGGTTVILVTHHVEEIIPEVGHVALLRKGRLFAEGPKRDMLTAATMSALFETPLSVDQLHGYYFVRPAP